jgi:hypothetical protein
MSPGSLPGYLSNPGKKYSISPESKRIKPRKISVLAIG